MAQATGIVLAAGSGSRMGTPKAELVVDGIRLLDRAVAALTAAGCRYVVAVVRAGVEVDGARAVINPQPSRGMRSSLQLGLDAAAEFGSDDIAVLLVDTPGVDAVAIRTVLNGVRPGRIAVGTYNGRRGHPTVMSVALWRRALELAGPDEGGRALLRAQPELVDEIAADGDPIDLDTLDDLNAWTGRAGVPAPLPACPER
jgi:molybdenum cofactor cytidylyltransferase/nicotine blue oxidoreductase